MTSNKLKFGRRLGYPLNQLVRRIRHMATGILLIFFGFAANYFFPLLQKIIADPRILTVQEWSAIVLLFVLPIALLLVLGRYEKNDRIAELAEAIRVVSLPKKVDEHEWYRSDIL